jgi:hypothetical protein
MAVGLAEVDSSGSRLVGYGGWRQEAKALSDGEHGAARRVACGGWSAGAAVSGGADGGCDGGCDLDRGVTRMGVSDQSVPS